MSFKSKIKADHKNVLSSVKKWRDEETWERLVLNALQLYFKRRDAKMTKQEIVERYVCHPLMTQYLLGKMSKMTIGQFIQAVDVGTKKTDEGLNLGVRVINLKHMQQVRQQAYEFLAPVKLERAPSRIKFLEWKIARHYKPIILEISKSSVGSYLVDKPSTPSKNELFKLKKSKRKAAKKRKLKRYLKRLKKQKEREAAVHLERLKEVT